MFCNNYVYLALTVATFREIARRHIVAVQALYELNGSRHYSLCVCLYVTLLMVMSMMYGSEEMCVMYVVWNKGGKIIGFIAC